MQLQERFLTNSRDFTQLASSNGGYFMRRRCMKTQSQSNDRMPHVAVFPPANHQACKLETWNDSAATLSQRSSDQLISPLAREMEEQDPERWDGLS
jgi:hypothetical protein